VSSQKLTNVALELVDEPDNPIRERFDEAALDDLAKSIALMGLIEPIVVERTGERFKVIAGHRRLLACRRAGLLKVPAVVRGDADTNREAVMFHENLERTDLSPAEEARAIRRLYDALGEDLEQTAAKLKLSEAYVNGRLLLLAGDAEILAAVDADEIPLGVAYELNQITREDLRRTYLHDCKISGANVRQAREWRLKANAFANLQGIQQERGEQPAAAEPDRQPIIKQTLDCELCESGQDLEQLRIVHIHMGCLRLVRRLMKNALDTKA
jgi:ParB family transcriptional regulator, chromosome partitioning protein